MFPSRQAEESERRSSAGSGRCRSRPTYYLAVLGASTLEEWRGTGGTVSEIARAVCLNANKHRRVLNVIVKTHHALLTSAEYDSMREFRAGSVAVKSGSPEE